MIPALCLGLLLAPAPTAAAAPKKAPVAQKAGSDEALIPPQSWSLIAAGFRELFSLRLKEISAAEPNRFFEGTVAFVLTAIDLDGHFLLMKCHAAPGSCNARKEALEERVVLATLLETVRTKAPKDKLYNRRTWEISPLGDRYLEILRRRYPDLNSRLARLAAAAFREKR